MFKEVRQGAPIDFFHFGKAIAEFEFTLVFANAPLDRFARGHEQAMSASEKRGGLLFFGKAKCRQCHAGNNFTDSKFHNLGIGWDPATKQFSDEGRFVVTKNEADRGSFKTPTLREVALTAPYMHDGSLATLEAVVEFYDQGGRQNRNLFPTIRPLGLTAEEKQALVKFLDALSGVVSG